MLATVAARVIGSLSCWPAWVSLSSVADAHCGSPPEKSVLLSWNVPGASRASSSLIPLLHSGGATGGVTTALLPARSMNPLSVTNAQLPALSTVAALAGSAVPATAQTEASMANRAPQLRRRKTRDDM